MYDANGGTTGGVKQEIQIPQLSSSTSSPDSSPSPLQTTTTTTSLSGLSNTTVSKRVFFDFISKCVFFHHVFHVGFFVLLLTFCSYKREKGAPGTGREGYQSKMANDRFRMHQIVKNDTKQTDRGLSEEEKKRRKYIIIFSCKRSTR